MQNFNNIKYESISYEKTKQEISKLLDELKKAKSYDPFFDICKKIISIQNHIEEMYDYADIRNMRDCNDLFFYNEIEYWNEFKPKFDLLFSPFYVVIIHSKYRSKLAKIMPSNFFSSIEYQLRISSKDITELQKQENELKKKYRDLEKTKIMFDGEERSFSYFSSFFNNKDRKIRKKAHDAINDYYYKKQKEYDQLFYDLINTRNRIAKKLGFNNYSTYSLYKQRRFGYNYKDINKFRNNIIQYIIPLCKKITDWQKGELALEELEYYDTVFFKETPHMKYTGMEVAEMFSYAMELISMNYLENLFCEEDYKKYCFLKIYNLVINLPYICLVDEFQEKIYTKKDLKIEDVRSIWLELVKKYHVEKSNSGHINLEAGGYFYRQSHIFLDPFYYIDYALSYFGAFAIWDKCKNDLKLFKKLGAVASYYSFHKLIKNYEMPNPFEEETIKNISIKLETELSNKRIIK